MHLRSRQGETGESCHCRHVIGLFRTIGSGPGPSERRARITICLGVNASFRFHRTCSLGCKYVCECVLDDGIFD